MAYASRTGTRRNLERLRLLNWGLLFVAGARGSTWEPNGFRYGIDNGAFSAWTQGTEWSEKAFLKVVDLLGANADFIILPDIVAGGLASLEKSLSWLPKLQGTKLLLLPVQDGMNTQDVAPFLDSKTGIFLGGSTEWKLDTLMDWGRLSREKACHLHVGRVNSIKRISSCAVAGAHSFDGTSASRYAVTAQKLDGARRQTAWNF